MDGRNIEPRTVLWAVAEVSWEDPTGTPYRAPATLEDTSPSGACIRLKSPISIGSRLVVKWKREQFSAIARNCRSDGKAFLLGVRRDTEHTQINPPRKKNERASEPPELAGSPPKDLPQLSMKAQSNPREASQKKSAPNFAPALAPLGPALPDPASVLAESRGAPRRISPATAAVQESNPLSRTVRRADPPRRAQS